MKLMTEPQDKPRAAGPMQVAKAVFWSFFGIRKRAALHFERVTSVKIAGFDPNAPEGTLELLTIRFTETEAPSGYVDLAFAGGGTVRLEVEVLEARLADLGAAWAAKQKPEHAV